MEKEFEPLEALLGNASDNQQKNHREENKILQNFLNNKTVRATWEAIK